MAIRITCPDCQTPLTLNEDMRGKKVRCRKCEKALSVPTSNGIKRKPSSDDEEQEEMPEESQPGKKKKKKKVAKQSSVLLIGVIAGIVLVVLLAGGGVSAVYLLGSGTDPADAKGKQQAKGEGEEKKDPKNLAPPIRIIPKIQEGNPANKKGGSGVLEGPRGAVYRTERRSELKQIGLAFVQFADEFKGANRTKENFLESIKTFGPIRDAIKDGYYVVNMQADVSSSVSIIAYERDIDRSGYLCVRGDTSVDYVPENEWKAALGKP